MIDDDLIGTIGMGAAALLLHGRGGKPPCVEVVRRWANPRRGCWPQGKDGPQLLLKTVKVGGELLTRPEWVREFEAERVRLGRRDPAPPSPRQPSAKRRALEDRQAEAILRQGGVLKPEVGGQRSEVRGQQS